MAIKVTFDTTELQRFADDLGKAGGRIGAKASAALRKAAFDIERRAKIKAPYEFGNLQESIETRFAGDGRFGGMAAEVRPTVDYGIWQELGTSRMAPQPYLGPAFDEVLPGFEAAMGQLGGEIL